MAVPLGVDIHNLGVAVDLAEVAVPATSEAGLVVENDDFVRGPITDAVMGRIKHSRLDDLLRPRRVLRKEYVHACFLEVELPGANRSSRLPLVIADYRCKPLAPRGWNLVGGLVDSPSHVPIEEAVAEPDVPDEGEGGAEIFCAGVAPLCEALRQMGPTELKPQ
jgi:hypothetical protein